MEAYDSNLQLYGNNTLKIDLTGTGKDTHGFRDPLRLSYRIHTNSSQSSDPDAQGRYVTNASGLSIFSPSIISDGIHYNHQPGTPDPGVIWAISFDQNATTVSSLVDTAQTLVTATLTRSSGSNDINYAVSYSFDDGKSGERFLMTKNGSTETIPFDLTFTPHGNAYIEKGTKYNWYVGSALTSIAYLKLHNLAIGAMNKEAGTYRDTITVTVTALDSGTVTENN